MTHGSLFSGIGGFDLAAEWMGWENIFHCEWNHFGQKVLKHYWPNSISYNDITQTDFTIHRGKIDILTGGFPCQPYSTAGKRLGKEDARHLWPEMLRAIQEIQPRWVVGENVRGLTNWNGGLVFDEVQADLEAKGYEVTPFLLPACAVNAPHRRDRIWFVAYAKSNGGSICELGKSETRQQIQTRDNINGFEGLGDATDADLHGCNKRNGNDEVNASKGWFYALGDINEGNEYGDATDAEFKGLQGMHKTWSKNINNRENTKIRGSIAGCNKKNNWQNFPTVSPICDGDDGLSDRLDSITFPKWRNESIKAGGNAIVPQVVYQIFKAIQEYERIRTANKD